MSEVRKEVIDEARTKGAKVHFASLMDIRHLKNAELETKHQKYKDRVVLQGDNVKDDSGSYAVFTEQGSSASVEISFLSSPHVNMSISNHSTTRKSWRSDAPIICLDGSVTPVGPGQNPQYTGAVQRREAVGCSQGLKMSPQKQHGSGASVAVPQPASQFSAVCDD